MLSQPPLLDPLDRAHLRRKILDRSQFVRIQAFPPEPLDENLKHVADTTKLPAIGADILKDIGLDLGRAGVSKIHSEKAELIMREFRDPGPRVNVLCVANIERALTRCKRGHRGLVYRQR